MDLEKAYYDTALKVASDHQETLIRHFEDAGKKSDEDSRSTMLCIPGDTSIEQYFETLDTREQSEKGDDIAAKLVGQARQKLSATYWHTRTKRMAVERYRCQDVRVYNELLRNLYPMSEDMRPFVKSVWKAYVRLPQPRTRHVQPQHLEDLLSLFMGPGVRHHQGRGMFVELITDLAKSGMPISSREAAAALNVVRDFSRKERDAADKVSSWLESTHTLLEDVAQSQSPDLSQHLDVGTLNVMLGLAYRSGRDDLVASVWQVFDRSGLEPDKTTHLVGLMDCARKGDAAGVRAKYEDIKNGTFVIDMSVINAVMKTFLMTGMVEPAESMFRRLAVASFRTTALQQTRQLSYRTSARLKSILDSMDYMLQVVRSESRAASRGIESDKKLNYFVPLIPDYHTYSMFLTHYSTVAYDYDKSIGVLHLMLEQGLTLDRYVFLRLFDAFATAPAASAQGWTLERLNYITNLLCDLQREHQSEPLCTKIMAQHARRAYERFVSGKASPNGSCLDVTDNTPPALDVRSSEPFQVYVTLRKMAAMGS